MPNIEIPDELWGEITAQQALFNFPTQVDFLKFCVMGNNILNINN
jgi:hypothetical protein